MTQAVIRVEGIGKRYRIGANRRASHYTLRDAVSVAPRQALARIRGGHTRTEEFWALRDVDLEVEQGDILGLVGRNGAGKSTLLKILSRIVEPTAGRAVLSGRVASLLEVGTGFHTELTGRENIFLNGAILGMRRREIQSKFDEIVEFSEVGRFLDTPVKFYSSGMSVRLAFAVAAHLEPDILLVDEVLAVGDRQFQKKSVSKMSSVARDGRTVIFVSHNMSAVLDLCDRGALIEGGRLARLGTIEEIVEDYARQDREAGGARFERPGFDAATHVLLRAELSGPAGETTGVFAYGEPLRIRIETGGEAAREFGLELRIKNSLRQPIAHASSWIERSESFRAGDVIDVTLPSLLLAEGTYYVDFICRLPEVKHVDHWPDDVSFTVVDASPGGSPVSVKASDELGTVVLEDVVFTSR